MNARKRCVEFPTWIDGLLVAGPVLFRLLKFRRIYYWTVKVIVSFHWISAVEKPSTKYPNPWYFRWNIHLSGFIYFIYHDISKIALISQLINKSMYSLCLILRANSHLMYILLVTHKHSVHYHHDRAGQAIITHLNTIATLADVKIPIRGYKSSENWSIDKERARLDVISGFSYYIIAFL